MLRISGNKGFLEKVLKCLEEAVKNSLGFISLANTLNSTADIVHTDFLLL